MQMFCMGWTFPQCTLILQVYLDYEDIDLPVHTDFLHALIPFLKRR